jgi:hypothetical protein
MQRQLSNVMSRLSAIEERPATNTTTPPLLPYGLPGYGGIPFPSGPLGYGGHAFAPSAASAIVHTTTTGQGLPITQIPFPHLPSPLPIFTDHPPAPHVFPQSAPALVAHSRLPTHFEDQADMVDAPRFRKLIFPTFDGKSDPLGWLNKCAHFFRAQRST